VYTNSQGVATTTSITGLSSDSFGAVNFTYDQLVYLSPPYVDTQGILVSVTAGTRTPAGNILGDQVINIIQVNTTSNNVVEQTMSPQGQLVTTASGTMTTTSSTASSSTGNTATSEYTASVMITLILSMSCALAAVLLL